MQTDSQLNGKAPEIPEKGACRIYERAIPLFSLSNYFGNRKNIRSRVN